METNAILVLGIFVFTYILIFSKRVHRTTAALVGAVFVVCIGMIRDFLTEDEALSFIRFDVIGILLGMMIIVSILKDSGFFEYVAIKVAKKSKGNLWTLLSLFGVSTAVLSMFVDNVTTILLMIPMIVVVSKMLEISAVPFLLSSAILSNVGGSATLVGDPPNIIIASYAQFKFNDFIFHVLPIVIILLIVSLFTFKFFYRDWLKTKPKNIEKLMAMNPNEKVKDWKIMKRTLAVLLGTIILFVFHDKLGVNPATVAMIGGVSALLITGTHPYKALLDVEWQTLLYFSGLFVIVGAVAHEGLLSNIADFVIDISKDNSLLAAILILWISAIGTSFIDRIPFTAAMCPVILHMGEIGMDVNLIWWALVMGVGFGSNSTPVGSSVGIITWGLSEKYNEPVTIKEWMKKGTPIALISVCFATIVLVLVSWI